MRSASAILRLVRWPNALIAAAGVLVGAWWVGAPPDEPPVVAAALSAIALAAYANADNDWHDREIDRVAHPERPLPRGELSPALARRVALTGAVLGVLLAVLARPALGALSIAVVALMWAYDRGLKASGLAGNIVVALLASLPFAYGAWAAGHPGGGLSLVALAVPLHLAREVAKDLEDRPGDLLARRTLPIVAGPAAARGVCIASLVLFLAVLAPFAVRWPRFALLVTPALALCALAAWRVLAGRRGGPLLLKTAMVCAMASLVLGRAA